MTNDSHPAISPALEQAIDKATNLLCSRVYVHGHSVAGVWHSEYFGSVLRDLVRQASAEAHAEGRRAALLEAEAEVRAHKCEVIADGQPDTVIDAYVDGSLAGYRDAVEQIATAIAALAESPRPTPPETTKD